MSSIKVGELEIELKSNTLHFDEGLEKSEKKARSFSEIVREAVVTNIATKAFDAVTEGLSKLGSGVIDTGMQFEAAMSEVSAISGATGDDLALLEKTARDFGSTTQFSASEAADALKYMSLAGWDANQSASALDGVLDLAAASGMELGQASDLVTDYLSAFGMEAQQSAYFADMLAYAQSNSNTTAAALGEAYKNCAANLNAAGQDIETTTSLLSMMADQGLKGSEAGTALNAVMRDMTAKMKDGAIAIGDTKVQVMDANGGYRDMTDILKDVEAATQGMGDAERATALAATFTADSTKGLNLILNAGVDKAAAFEEALRGSEGAASEMAGTMNDNLAGNVKTLQSAFEQFQLVLYEKVEPILSNLVKVGTDVVNWLSKNSEVVIAVAGTVGAAIVGIFAVKKIKSAIDTFKSAFNSVKSFLTGHKNDVQSVAKSVMNSADDYGKATSEMASSSESLSSRISGAINGITDVIKTTLESLGEILSSAVNAVMEPIKALLTGIGEAIAGFFTAIANPEILLGIAVFAAAAAGVAAAILLIGAAIGVVTPGLADFLNSVLIPLGTFLVETFLVVLNEIIDGIIRLTNEAVIPFGEFVRDTIIGVVNSLTDAIIRLTQEALIPLIREVRDFLDWLFAKVESVVSKVKNTLKNMLDWIGQNIIEPIKNLFEGVWEKVTEIFDNISNGIKNALGGAINFIIGAIEGAINGVIKLINTFIEAVNAVSEHIGITLSPIGEVSFPRVEFAKGGIVPGTSYYGDRVPALVNSGEMVITRAQQAALWNAIDSGELGGGAPAPNNSLDSIERILANAFGDEYEGTVTTDDRPLTVYMENNIDNSLDIDQVGNELLAQIRRVA